ncbi:RHS repeat-associated core domain-containing protein [Pseudomonas putida]|uniref:RHS repeat-associated core domain-containing protein n=1 Tax=Pseudomonas putida TaxID=303 RepID=UPI002365AA8E|nr:RHS repeat-associated core domain-containing protein [Pseudomonas putida]MDD2048222.1 RHS repeat-associated core domain-containing protein [Pseudomonas putida]
MDALVLYRICAGINKLLRQVRKLAGLLQPQPKTTMDNQHAHRNTPDLLVYDPRGKTLRSVVYERTSANDPAVARITRSWSSADKRIARQYDPRLFALSQTEAQPPANLQTLSSLSGAVLLNESVDSGWNLTLNTESGQASDSWDSRGSHAWMEYDALLRPLAQHEQAKDGSARVSSRFSYAPGNAGEAAINRCGRPARLDDDAGTELYLDYSMAGAAIRTSRHWTRHNTLPDWPLEIPARDALLRETPAAVTSIRHNALAEPISQNDAQQNRQTFAHTRGGQLHSIRLTPAEAQPVQIASDLRYNAHGQIVQQRLGNGVLSTLVYDPTNGQLRQHRTAHPDASLLQDLHYQRDPLGNIVAIEDAAQPIRFFRNQTISARRTFAYDSLYRLIQATGFEAAENLAGPELPGFQSPPDPTQLANYSREYRYDEAGNLTTVRHVGAQNFTRHQANAPTSNRGLNHNDDAPPPSEAAINAAFDGNGNLKALQPGQALTWSVKNQLLEVSQVTRDTANDTELYRYDHSGRRQRKLRSWQSTRGEHAEEVHYLPGLERRYNSARSEELHISIVSTPLGEVRLLHWQAGRPSGLSNDQYRYGIADHQRSCGLELDAQARLISQEAYYPYGGTAWWAGHDQVQANYKVIRYSGQERDATGLYYYGMRYYAPWLQRWINPDPAGVADGLNLYAMVHGNPVGNVDQQGLATATEVATTAVHAALRDGPSLLLGALLSIGINDGIDQILVNDAAHLAFTISVGVAAGAAAAFLTHPTAGVFTDRLRGILPNANSTTVAVAVGTTAFALGAAPALIDIAYPQQDEQGNSSTSNTARTLVRSVGLNAVYQTVQQLTATLGNRFSWDNRPEFRTSALVTGVSALSRAAVSFAGLDRWQALGTGTAVEIVESAAGTYSRSRSDNAALAPGSGLNISLSRESATNSGREFLNAMVGRITTSAVVAGARQATRLLPDAIGVPLRAALGALTNMRTFVVARVGGQSASSNIDPGSMRNPGDRALANTLPSSESEAPQITTARFRRSQR